MLILGIDPGTATTGFGLLRIEKEDFEVVNFGLIETDKDGEPGVRLIKIFKEMDNLLSIYSPDIVAIEKLFFANNAKTAIRVGQAQGVMLYCAAMKNISLFEYAPGTIKKQITGNGRADKKTIQQSLRKIFGAKIRSKAKKRTHFDNAADALAIALCHAIKTNLTKSLLV